MSVLRAWKRKYDLHPNIKGWKQTDAPDLREANHKAGNSKYHLPRGRG